MERSKHFDFLFRHPTLLWAYFRALLAVVFLLVCDGEFAKKALYRSVHSNVHRLEIRCAVGRDYDNVDVVDCTESLENLGVVCPIAIPK